MVSPKIGWLAIAIGLCAGPVFAQEACDGCAAPRQADWPADHARQMGHDDQAVYDQSSYGQSSYGQSSYGRAESRVSESRFSEHEVRQDQRYVTQSRTVTRVSYSEGYLSWPGKDAAGYVDGAAYGQGPDGRVPDCPPVKPGERVISCRYVPIAQQRQEADIAPSGGVLYAEGGVGPDYIPAGGGGGGTTIVEAGASSESSASASASASASVFIEERGHDHGHGGHKPPTKDCNCDKGGGGSYGGGGSWGSGSMGGGHGGGGGYGGGGSWGSGSMGGGSWGSGSMGGRSKGGGGSWGGGSMGGNGGASWSGGSMGGVSGGSWGSHGGHFASHGGAHGHGRR